MIKGCNEVIDKNKDAIYKGYLHSNEEAILVTSYTYEAGKGEVSPYRVINEKLREGKAQDQLTNKKSYLRLLLRALRKLPRTKPQTLYRGIRSDTHEYKVGEKVEWQGFTSTTTSMSVTQNFLRNRETKKVEGTLFEIRDEWGYDVAAFSKYPDEEGKMHKQSNFYS